MQNGVCVCVCVCARVRARVCVCMCVCAFNLKYSLVHIFVSIFFLKTIMVRTLLQKQSINIDLFVALLFTSVENFPILNSHCKFIPKLFLTHETYLHVHIQCRMVQLCLPLMIVLGRNSTCIVNKTIVHKYRLISISLVPPNPCHLYLQISF